MQTILLTSGGLESFLLWALAGRERAAQSVFVQTGHPGGRREHNALERLRRHLAGFEFRMVRGPTLGCEPVRTRLIHLVTAAVDSMRGQSVEVWVGGGGSDPAAYDLALSGIQHAINALMPDQTLVLARVPQRATLTSLVRSYLDAGFDEEHLHHTVSCGDGGDRHCGQCPKCFSRWVALRNNGLSQPWRYASPQAWGIYKGIAELARREGVDGHAEINRAYKTEPIRHISEELQAFSA